MIELFEYRLKNKYTPSFKTRTVPFDNFKLKAVQHLNIDSEYILKPYGRYHTSTSFDGCYSIYERRFVYTMLIRLDSPEYTPIFYIYPYGQYKTYIDNKPVVFDYPYLVLEAEAIVDKPIRADDVFGVVIHIDEKAITERYEELYHEFCKERDYRCRLLEYNYETIIKELDWLKSNYKVYNKIPETDFNRDIKIVYDIERKLARARLDKKITMIDYMIEYTKVYAPFIKGICEVYDINYENVIKAAINRHFEFVLSRFSDTAIARMGIDLTNPDKQRQDIINTILAYT